MLTFMFFVALSSQLYNLTDRLACCVTMMEIDRKWEDIWTQVKYDIIWKNLIKYDDARVNWVRVVLLSHTSFSPHTSYLIPHTSYLIPHTSYLIPHTSYLIPHDSCLIRHTSYLIPYTWFILHTYLSHTSMKIDKQTLEEKSLSPCGDPTQPKTWLTSIGRRRQLGGR